MKTVRVTMTAVHSGSSRRHNRYPARTASPVTMISARPTRVQAGTSSRAAVRPTSQGNSGGYSPGRPGIQASELAGVTEYRVASAVSRPASPSSPKNGKGLPRVSIDSDRTTQDDRSPAVAPANHPGSGARDRAKTPSAIAASRMAAIGTDQVRNPTPVYVPKAWGAASATGVPMAQVITAIVPGEVNNRRRRDRCGVGRSTSDSEGSPPEGTPFWLGITRAVTSVAVRV